MTDVKYDIYLIEAPGLWYVGSTTIGVSNRFHQHLTRRKAPILGSKIIELGPEAFTVTTLERGFGNPLLAEQRWYDVMMAEDVRQTMNCRRPGGWPTPPRGRKHTPEAIAKIKAARAVQPPNRLGIKHTPETRAKMSASRMGHPTSPETRAKISAAQKGIPKRRRVAA